MYSRIKKLYWLVIVSIFSLISSSIAFATVTQLPDTSPAIIKNPLGTTSTIPAFILLILDTAFPIVTLLAIFFMIYAGFRMVIFASNEEKLSEAKRAFLWTVIGVAILLGAKVLSAVICGTINQLNPLAPLKCSI